MEDKNVEYDDMPITLNNHVTKEAMEFSKDYRRGRVKYILTRIWEEISTVVSFLVMGVFTLIATLIFGSED